MKQSSLKLLGTDLDRTLFPNGDQPAEPGAMNRFAAWVKSRSFPLVYNSGRSRDEILEGVETYQAPRPDIMVGEVGTRIYFQNSGQYEEDLDWLAELDQKVPGWNPQAVDQLVLRFSGAVPQPPHHQNSHKRSFFLRPEGEAARLAGELTDQLTQNLADLTTVYSVDETTGECLFDVLPVSATKVNAMEYLRKKFSLTRSEVFFSGDSGNDLEALTAGYCSVLVRNATKSVREKVTERANRTETNETLYIARGEGPHGNGFYTSGVLEGLAYFGFLET